MCLLADGDGRIVGEARGGGANLQASGELEVEKVLHQVMDAAIGERDVRPAAICLGIAGVDRPDDTAAVQSIMRRIGFKAQVIVVNDALVALVAGAGDAPGVVVVAGTGSIAYGRDSAGRAARAGGWGYLLGDEGGGFWIGRAANSKRLICSMAEPCRRLPASGTGRSPRSGRKAPAHSGFILSLLTRNGQKPRTWFSPALRLGSGAPTP